MSNYIIPEIGGEVVNTSFDPKTGICKYVICRHLEQWHVEIPLSVLEEYGENKDGRKQHFIRAVLEKMKSPPDVVLKAEEPDGV